MIDQATIDAIADAVVERLRAETPQAGRKLTAAEVAERQGVSVDTVYANASRWGGVKVGAGPKARWRFDADALAERLTGSGDSPEGVAQAARPTSRRRPSSEGADLLPIRGMSER
jgi:hypothetical protein